MSKGLRRTLKSSAAALLALLTDSSGGTASATLAAGVGITTIALHVNLVSLTTAAADLITAVTPGYAFKVLSVDYFTTKLGTGSGASQSLNLAIGSTAVTGGVVNPVLATTDVLGKKVAGSAVTALNTGTASDTLSLKVAASGTVFTAGEGMVLVRIQNLDTVNAVASLAAKVNAIINAAAGV